MTWNRLLTNGAARVTPEERFAQSTNASRRLEAGLLSLALLVTRSRALLPGLEGRTAGMDWDCQLSASVCARILVRPKASASATNERPAVDATYRTVTRPRVLRGVVINKPPRSLNAGGVLLARLRPVSYRLIDPDTSLISDWFRT